MGYYTDYTLTVTPIENLPEIKAAMKANLDEHLGWLEWYGEGLEGHSNGKWYSHTEDLQNFSLHFPNNLFVLQGVGEEYPDIWKLYVKNGKSFLAKANITFSNFDETLLV